MTAIFWWSAGIFVGFLLGCAWRSWKDNRFIAKCREKYGRKNADPWRHVATTYAGEVYKWKDGFWRTTPEKP